MHLPVKLWARQLLYAERRSVSESVSLAVIWRSWRRQPQGAHGLGEIYTFPPRLALCPHERAPGGVAAAQNKTWSGRGVSCLHGYLHAHAFDLLVLLTIMQETNANAIAKLRDQSMKFLDGMYRLIRK